MPTSDSKVTPGPILEIEGDLRDRIEKSMPERLARYGYKEKDFPKLRSLNVLRSMTLSTKDRKSPASKDFKQIRVKDFRQLKEMIGTRSEFASKVGMADEDISEARSLIERLKDYRPEKGDRVALGTQNRMLRRLAEIYIYRGNEIMEKPTLEILRRWRSPIEISLVPWWNIIVESGQTLTIAADVQILWAVSILLRPGAKIRSLGPLRIDAFRLERQSRLVIDVIHN